MKDRILEVLKNAEKPLRPGEIAAATLLLNKI